ncbi:MAG: hypothetical protein QY331_03090 [Melioribacteraceae bacterium]|nr:MAG: hypothetical protein QY331_03090 [Melioribacteraceae bacterium]
MGQQQLLLITLGVIIVGSALIVGMNLFHTNAIESNRNGVTNDLLHIATMSQIYFRKTSELGGGNKSFVGFQIPNQLLNNENGEYSVVYLRSDRALFQGIGVEPLESGVGCTQGGDYVTHRILVFPDSVQVEIVY